MPHPLQSARAAKRHEKIQDAARRFRAFDDARELLKRNAVAVEFFKVQANRLLKYEGHGTVETWWDAHSRNWITQTKDAVGDTEGDSIYSGNALSAAYEHLRAVTAFLVSINAIER